MYTQLLRGPGRALVGHRDQRWADFVPAAPARRGHMPHIAARVVRSHSLQERNVSQQPSPFGASLFVPEARGRRLSAHRYRPQVFVRGHQHVASSFQSLFPNSGQAIDLFYLSNLMFDSKDNFFRSLHYFAVITSFQSGFVVLNVICLFSGFTCAFRS